MTTNSTCRRETQDKNRSTSLYKHAKFKSPTGFEMLLTRNEKKCKLLIKLEKVDLFECRNE